MTEWQPLPFTITVYSQDGEARFPVICGMNYRIMIYRYYPRRPKAPARGRWVAQNVMHKTWMNTTTGIIRNVEPFKAVLRPETRVDSRDAS